MGLHAIDYVHRHATSGTVIGEPDCRGEGFAPLAKELLLGYAFDTLGLHRVTAEVIAGNTASIRQLEKSGYTLEGLKREHVFRGGRWHNELVYGILDHEWRTRRDTLTKTQ